MKSFYLVIFSLISTSLFANTIPIGKQNSALYYKMGGGNTFTMPPVGNNNSININAGGSVGLGFSCSGFNPALSIVNSFNNIKNDVSNIDSTIVANATGAILQLPMYELRRLNPSLAALIDKQLFNSKEQIKISTKDCNKVKEQAAKGQNPYQDWASISVGDQWKEKLTLIHDAPEKNDINKAYDEVKGKSGEGGVTWVQGVRTNDDSYKAGGLNQPPVKVISDTVKAGYNAILNRDLNSDDSSSDNELSLYYRTPSEAQKWIVEVVGEKIISTCNEKTCQRNQGGSIGRGLLPFITSCKDQTLSCTVNIRNNLARLVNGDEQVTEATLEKVSASGTMMSPDVINSIKMLARSEQAIVVSKLAEEIALQQLINKALIARRILLSGSQVPIIAASHPAQAVIKKAINDLDSDLKQILFESNIRKQIFSSTVSDLLTNTSQKEKEMTRYSASSSDQLLEDGALHKRVDNE